MSLRPPTRDVPGGGRRTAPYSRTRAQGRLPRGTSLRPGHLGYLSHGRLTLITGPLKAFERRGTSRDGTQECVIPPDFLDGLVREGHPPLVSPAEKSLM